MRVSKAEKKKRRLEAKRKAADDHQSSDRRMKRKLNEYTGVREKEHQGAGGQSEEALFKIRHAAEFDDESVTDIGDQKNVKQEEQKLDSGNAAEASQSAISMIGSRPNHETPLPRPATKPDSVITDRVDQEDNFGYHPLANHLGHENDTSDYQKPRRTGSTKGVRRQLVRHHIHR